ncbi:putative protein QUIRKY [Iris pallida]|uniref:C2 domain-containing protein n=1 Tax=Iris pallida TaxID=29817 RepID=A0AAX6HGX7_IRIPA|nr:putative protein QUIRKY [Iris pallida]
MKLAVEVMDAYDLMPKDGRGSSNPFVEVDFDGQVHRTPTKFKDLNPSWNQTLLFNLSDPRALHTQTLDVCVYHDSSSSSSSSTRRRHFLGRVRISGISIAASPEEAQVQRFPLEKRGLFSNISGDLALRIYTLDNSSQTSMDQDQQLKQPPPQEEAQDTMRTTTLIEDQAAAAAAATSASGTSSRPPPQQQQQQQQRVFFSVPAEVRRPPQPPQPGPMEFRAVPMQAAPPPQAAPVQVRPGMPMNIPGRPPQNDYGLIETAPPIAGRLGYRAIDKISSTYDLVEQMHYLYVNVVKARDLPTMDLTGSLDPYAEVKLGNYRGTTRYVEKNSNPVWQQTFAFSKERLQANLVEVAVKDKDFLKDDFVGRVVVSLTDVPFCVPPDGPLAPQWYWLMDKKGERLSHGEIMLAIWIGTQADEAFPDAWHSDAHNLGLDGMNQTRSKVYFSPKLCYLRVQVIEAQDLVPHDRTRTAPEVCARVQIGNQVRATRVSQVRSVNPVWNEEFMFVASEPFDEPLIVTVEDRVGPSRSEPLGRVRFPVSMAYQRTDNRKTVESRWLDLARPDSSEEEVVVSGESKKKESKFSSKIHLRVCLETGYHVLDESTHYSSDLQPSSKHLRNPMVGLLELGILSARNLIPMKAKEGRTTDAYCVAKYGPKWVRTRTLLDTLAPRWNEQYTWEVFDPCTVITIAVFDNCHFSSHFSGSGGNHNNTRDQRIGKVRIRLSTLETERVYTHYYPLLVLQPSGLKKTGELHLAVRFTCTAWVNTMTLYGKPLLPKMHYVQPIAVVQLDILRHQAMQIVAARLARAEPPLRREVVEYMLDVDSHMWSLRRSKANFYRITSLLSGLGAIVRWLDSVRSWRNPVTTILVHALFLILVCYPEMILPTVFLCLFMTGIWNYRYRPRKPPHMDTKLSYAEAAHPDELDEEFDTFPTSKPSDIVRMRYDRMRSVGGRVQTVAGDLATQGERVHALLSWRDPRATAIFIFLSLVWALVLYVTPFQVVVVLVGLYLLRHPRFRSKLPSVPYNFYRRLPAKSDSLL